MKLHMFGGEIVFWVKSLVMDGCSPKYGNHRCQAMPILLVTYPIPSSIPTYFNVIYPHVLFLKSEFMSHINIHVALSEKLPPQISINFMAVICDGIKSPQKIPPIHGSNGSCLWNQQFLFGLPGGYHPQKSAASAARPKSPRWKRHHWTLPWQHLGIDTWKLCHYAHENNIFKSLENKMEKPGNAFGQAFFGSYLSCVYIYIHSYIYIYIMAIQCYTN